jgi:hypothetical protein
MSEEQEVPDRVALAVLLDYGYRWADYNGNACVEAYSALLNNMNHNVLPSASYNDVLGDEQFCNSAFRFRFHILLANNTPESLGLTNEQYQFLKGLPIE